MRKKEPLPFVTTSMKLEGIMLSEVSQTEGQLLRDNHLCVESKKAKLRETVD